MHWLILLIGNVPSPSDATQQRSANPPPTSESTS